MYEFCASLHRVTLFALSTGLALISPPAFGQFAPPVRNTAPEQRQIPLDEQWPVYCPGALRIGPLGADGEAASGGAEALLQQFIHQHSALQFDAALKTAIALVNTAPTRPLAHYNHACSLARLNRLEESLDALNQAIDFGWRNVTHTRLDPDLAAVHETIRFQHAMNRMRTLAETERIQPAPLRREPAETIIQSLELETPKLLERYHVPGAAVALVIEGKCVWQQGFGVVQEQGSESASPVNRFSHDSTVLLRSPTRLLTLIAAAMLDSERELDLGALLLHSEQAQQSIEPQRDERAARPSFSTARSGGIATAFGSPVPNQSTSNGAATFGQFSQDCWPTASTGDGAFSLLCLAIELASHESFETFCAARLLQPLKMQHSRFGIFRQMHDAPPVRGHTRLGSIIDPIDPAALERRAQRDEISTTTRDLARILECLLADESAPGAIPSGVTNRLVEIGQFDLRQLGFMYFIDETLDGVRMQLAEVTAGVGCLMRWYPEHRRGVVIVFNSETGPDAALRIAHLALGGE